jgi:hypothetical protein
MDTKGKYLLAAGECHPLSIVDDHSRYAVGLYARSGLNSEMAHGCLVETCRHYGVPAGMLMDRGSLWWSVHNGWGLTWLSVRLIEQGIRLHYGRVCQPQTQGKVEHFHRTLGAALRHRGVPERIEQWQPALDQFREEYNQRRPQEALEMQRPAERYRPSPRLYQEQPAAWDYPQGSEVRRLNTQGSLVLGSQRWFVCQALASQWVRIERLDGKLLVSNRHMYIREIDRAGRESRALVVARRESAPERLPQPKQRRIQKCKGCPGTACKGCLGNKHFRTAGVFAAFFHYRFSRHCPPHLARGLSETSRPSRRDATDQNSNAASQDFSGAPEGRHDNRPALQDTVGEPHSDDHIHLVARSDFRTSPLQSETWISIA